MALAIDRLGTGLWQRHLPIWSVAAVIVLLALGGEVAREALMYRRPAVAAGELWRLLTAHLVHLGPVHALLNAAGLLIIHHGFAGRVGGMRALTVLVACAAGVSVGLWFGSPQTAWYVGLSGALYGLITAWLLRALAHPDWVSGLVLAAVAGKVGWELVAGAPAALSDTVGGPVVTASHAYGMAAGALIGAGLWIEARRG